MTADSQSVTESTDMPPPSTRSVKVTVPLEWSDQDIQRLIRRENRKRVRTSETGTEDLEDEDSEEERTSGRPSKNPKLKLSGIREQKFGELVTQLRRHYARYYSINEKEIEDLIHTFFEKDLPVNDRDYKTVRRRVMSLTRTWQSKMIDSFEV